MSNLPTLEACLQQTPWRRLLGLMAANGLAASARWRKAELINALYAHLCQPTLLATIIPAFAPVVHRALQALLHADGHLPAAAFQERYGRLRPYRPWRQAAEGAEADQAAPWVAPASPAEALWWQGLIYLEPPKVNARRPQQVVIPAELLPALRHLLPLAQPPDNPPALTVSPSHPVTLSLLPRPGRPPDLVWHMALWLASVAAAPIRLLRGGWLPPTALHALARRLGLAMPTDPIDTLRFRPLPRSERAWPYLAFLHYLARAAGFVTGDGVAGGGLLALTPVAWAWLAAARSAQWRQLWQAWQTAPVELRAPFAFAWPALNRTMHDLLAEQLRRLPTDAFTPLADLVEQLHLHDRYHHFAPSPFLVDAQAEPVEAEPVEAEPIAAEAEPVEADSDYRDLVSDFDEPLPQELPGDPLADDPVAALCRGPLHWLGLLDLALGQAPDAIGQSAIRLTPHGAWLLAVAGWGAPAFAPPVACTLPARRPDLILAPPQSNPLHLARLAPCCDWQPPAWPALEQQLQLTADRVGPAVAAGLAPAQLLQILEDALGQPPSRRQGQRLRAWAKAGHQLRLVPMLVLESADAQLMGRLRSRKLVRDRLSTPLSPTRSAIQPAHAAALVQTLRTLELYVQLPPAYEPERLESQRAEGSEAEDSGVESSGVEDSGAESSGVDARSASASNDDQSAAHMTTRRHDHATPRAHDAHAGFLWLLLRFYQEVGAYLPLPMALPAGLREAIGAQLTPAQQSAAEAAVRQLVAALDQSRRGYHALPNPVAPPQTVDPRPLIEAALAAQQDLQITYAGGGRNDQSVRRVTPYYLETRHQIAYLIAWCHLREAERVFRVDRITSAVILDC